MSICDLENRRKVRKPMNVPYNFGIYFIIYYQIISINFFNNLDKSVIEFINEIFRMLHDLIDDKTCSGIGRDCCLDLVVKFVDRANGCNWTSKFIISGYKFLKFSHLYLI